MNDSTPTQPTPRNFVTWGASEARLLARAQADGDRAAMDELVTRMMPLARRLARKYQRPADQLDDLVQVASLALFRALQRFDPQRGVPFPAFFESHGGGARHRGDHGGRKRGDDNGARGALTLRGAFGCPTSEGHRAWARIGCIRSSAPRSRRDTCI